MTEARAGGDVEDRGREARRALLVELGAGGATLDALDAYVAIRYPQLPPAERDAAPGDEPHVVAWRRYADESRTPGTGGAGVALARRFPQLGFPIAAGMSADPEYRLATRQGRADESRRRPTGIAREDLLALSVEETLAGNVPVLVARHRPDFVFLVRSLTARNEPEPVPDAMGACLVKGLVNWERVAAERARYEDELGRAASEAEWSAEMTERIRPRKELWQDRLILLSDGPYSAIPASEVGLDEATWRERSLALRRAHEGFHYLTLRRHGLLRSHLLDELLADYAGLVAAFGTYDAARALRFLGLSPGAPAAERPGRWQIYRGALPAEAVPALARLIERAARGIERLPPAPTGAADFASRLLDLAAAGLDGLAGLGAEGAAAV